MASAISVTLNRTSPPIARSAAARADEALDRHSPEPRQSMIHEGSIRGKAVAKRRQVTLVDCGHRGAAITGRLLVSGPPRAIAVSVQLSKRGVFVRWIEHHEALDEPVAIDLANREGGHGTDVHHELSPDQSNLLAAGRQRLARVAAFRDEPDGPKRRRGAFDAMLEKRTPVVEHVVGRDQRRGVATLPERVGELGQHSCGDRGASPASCDAARTRPPIGVRHRAALGHRHCRTTCASDADR